MRGVAVLRHHQHGHFTPGEQLQHLRDLIRVVRALPRGQAVGHQHDYLRRRPGPGSEGFRDDGRKIGGSAVEVADSVQPVGKAVEFPRALGEDPLAHVGVNAQIAHDVGAQAVGRGEVLCDVRCIPVHEAFRNVEQHVYAGLGFQRHGLAELGQAQPQQRDHADDDPAQQQGQHQHRSPLIA